MMKKHFLWSAFFASLTLFAFATVSFADSFCGDGIKDTGEECDDSNFYNRDGCSSYCKLEDMTPPKVSTFSIPNQQIDVPTTTREWVLTFSEPVDGSSINDQTVYLEQNGTPLNLKITLESDKQTLTLKSPSDLLPETRYAIHVKSPLKDVPGNLFTPEYISVFDTGKEIDHTAPNIVITPQGGKFSVPQYIVLKPYRGDYTGSDDFLDTTAKIYYTLDGSTPSKNSKLYQMPFTIETNTTLKAFGIDTIGNVSSVQTQAYEFACDRPNAKEVKPYPSCKIVSCDVGYKIFGNSCVPSTSTDPDDLSNAAPAPLFSSDTPVTIMSRPALLITEEHKGKIPRPLNFIDSKNNIKLSFERDTLIKDVDGRAFAGYIRPPKRLYTKDFPVLFGYTFTSIIQFDPAEGPQLFFDPPYKLAIPFSEIYDESKPASVFTYDTKTKTFNQYDIKKVNVDSANKAVVVSGSQSNTFFVAQPGENFNRLVFADSQNHWASYYIEILYRKGFVKGRSPDQFAPEDPLTRAEFLKIALLAMGVSIPATDTIDTIPFIDVTLDTWYLPYVHKAKQLGMIKGYEDGTFQPDKPINRAEAIKMLVDGFGFNLADYGKETISKNLSKKDYVRSKLKYRDIDEDAWYFRTMDFVIQNGLLDGIRNKNGSIRLQFDPSALLKRGEMCKLAASAMDLAEKLKVKPKN